MDRPHRRWALLPLVAGEYYINLASQIVIFAVFAASINLLLGYGGLPTLGHAAYLGVAAYLSAWLQLKMGWSHWTTAPVALLGTTLTACAFGVIGGPIMSDYPGLDADMLPLALIVVILGGVGSLIGAFVGSFITGFVYTFGVALLPDLAYVILFLPMILVIAFRPRGLFGKFAA